jgi:hypothetical protein
MRKLDPREHGMKGDVYVSDGLPANPKLPRALRDARRSQVDRIRSLKRSIASKKASA